MSTHQSKKKKLRDQASLKKTKKMQQKQCVTLGWILEQKGGNGKGFFFLFFFSRKYILKYFKVSEHVCNYFQMIQKKTHTYTERYISQFNIFEEQRDNGKIKMR